MLHGYANPLKKLDTSESVNLHKCLILLDSCQIHATRWLGCLLVPLGTEQKVDRLAGAVDRPVQVAPLPADPDVTSRRRATARGKDAGGGPSVFAAPGRSGGPSGTWSCDPPRRPCRRAWPRGRGS